MDRVFSAAWLLLVLASVASGEPWNLPSYTLCRHTTLKGIPAEASGVTYSPVTNSIWVMTRKPQAFMEYSVTGLKLREVPYAGLSDPEGITWMYDYTFAVAQEGGGTAAITILDLLPWCEAAYIRKKLVLNDVKCETNFCFEGITYNAIKNVFYALQEQYPMKVWQVSPGSGTATELLNGDDHIWPKMRDLAGAYFRPASSTGIYLLSQTEQTVSLVNFNGTQLQQVKVNDNMVEGLTFTPDGKLMITVGEPNDLWVYNSTGSCDDWKPDPNYEPPPIPTAVEQAKLALITAPIDQDPDGGYCNWKMCNRKPEGNAWCNKNVDRCVGDCGGTWCWWDGIGKAITPDDYEGPTPEPTVEPTPAPTSGPEPEPEVEPVSVSVSVPPPPPQPREGFCNWNDCSKGMMGSADCNFNYKICLQACGGQWCWKDGFDPPLQKSDLVTLPSGAEIELPEEEVPAGGLDTEILLVLTTETPAPTLDLDSIPDNIQVVVVDDDSFKKMGYEGMVQLLLDNITVAQFTPLQQLYFRQAIAHVAYGNPNGFLQVVFNTSTLEMAEDYALFKGTLMPATLERLAEKALGADVAAEEDVLVLTAHLLGETKQHAINLANKTADAVASGKLATSLNLMGFLPNITIQVLNVNITESEVSPQYFPNSVVDNVTYGPNFEVVQVEIIDPLNGTEIIQVVKGTESGTEQVNLFDASSGSRQQLGTWLLVLSVLMGILH